MPYTPYNPLLVRQDFPILLQEVNGYPLVYLDNAATMQKPLVVIEALDHYYRSINSNIHRGVHYLSRIATSQYEEARSEVRDFINAKESCEIIFTRGTTESINLIARSFGESFFGPKAGIALTTMEHHSNMVPWQEIARKKDAPVHYIHFDKDGILMIEEAERILALKPALLAITHVSNVLGVVNPIKKLIEIAHSYNVPVLVDGAQAVAHTTVDVQDLDCDFYCFSGHKMYGPMGIGVLYGKQEILNVIPPYQFGGEMIEDVHLSGSTFNKLPFKFEAGTPPVAEALGLMAAIRYIHGIGLNAIATHEHLLAQKALEALNDIRGIEIYGVSQANKTSLVSFNITGAHHYDVGVILDQMGIAVRTGHHCAQPLMEELNIRGTVRASFALYNTSTEIDLFTEGVRKAKQMLL